MRSGSWLTAERVTGYAAILAVGNLVCLALAICRAHGWGLPEEPHFSTEFMSFFAAGRMVDAGQAAGVYLPVGDVPAYIHSIGNPAGFVALQQALTHDKQIAILAFYYPPVFWLICAPLAVFGFYTAYAIWVAGGLALALGLVAALLGNARKLWMAAAFLPVIKNAGVGENAFLSAGLIGFGFLLLPTRPIFAGILFGGLCYKPHFLLPIGILLLAQANWRALGAMVASGVLLCTAAGMVFGWQYWVDYVRIVVPHAQWMFQHHGFSYGIEVTPFSAVQMLGGGVMLGNVVHALCLVLAAGLIVLAVRRGVPDVQAAMVMASFPLMAPVMLDYDLCITGLAILFLIRAARETGFLAFEKTAMAGLFAMPLVVFIFRTSFGIPIDPVIPLLFIIVLTGRLGAKI